MPKHKVEDVGSLPTPVERTSAGLRACLFDELDRVRAGVSTPAQANAISTLVHKIGQTVLLEIQVSKYAAEIGSHRALPSPISLDGTAGAARPPQQSPVEAPATPAAP